MYDETGWMYKFNQWTFNFSVGDLCFKFGATIPLVVFVKVNQN